MGDGLLNVTALADGGCCRLSFDVAPSQGVVFGPPSARDGGRFFEV